MCEILLSDVGGGICFSASAVALWIDVVLLTQLPHQMPKTMKGGSVKKRAEYIGFVVYDSGEEHS